MHIRIYDNGGETCDRYTLIIDGDIYGLSDNAMSPQGFNQYCGTIGECGHTDHYNDDPGETLRDVSELPGEVQRAVELRVDSYA